VNARLTGRVRAVRVLLRAFNGTRAHTGGERGCTSPLEACSTTRKVESKMTESLLPMHNGSPALTERRVLVTGGAGFIGSHLCERLLERGDEVLCVDNFYTRTRRNVQHLLSNPLFEVMRHDVCFPLYVEVDEIFNLACPASPVHYQFDPVQTTKVSVHGRSTYWALLSA
jgi:GDP-mannose 4,6 dehydratase